MVLKTNLTNEKLQLKLKIIIFGDGGVGKSTLTQRFLTGTFIPNLDLTIGTNFYTKKLYFPNIEVSASFWDFGGEKRFRFLFPKYVIGASGGIFLYDLTRPSSLNNFDKWLGLLHKGLGSNNIIPIFIVGAKADLQRDIFNTKKFIPESKNSNIINNQYISSSKNGLNVNEIFYGLIENILKNKNL